MYCTINEYHLNMCGFRHPPCRDSWETSISRNPSRTASSILNVVLDGAGESTCCVVGRRFLIQHLRDDLLLFGRQRHDVSLAENDFTYFAQPSLFRPSLRLHVNMDPIQCINLRSALLSPFVRPINDLPISDVLSCQRAKT